MEQKNMPDDTQLTEEQAVALAEDEEYENWTQYEIARFQLFQERLCMPFDVFHEALETVLGRPIFTHEFALNVDGLKRELLGLEDAPTITDILDLIPDDKKVIAIVDTTKGDSNGTAE